MTPSKTQLRAALTQSTKEANLLTAQKLGINHSTLPAGADIIEEILKKKPTEVFDAIKKTGRELTPRTHC